MAPPVVSTRAGHRRGARAGATLTSVNACTPAVAGWDAEPGTMCACHGDGHQIRDAFVERLFGSALGTMDVFTVYLGDRLGLYRALAQHGSLTPRGTRANGRESMRDTPVSGSSSRPLTGSP